MLFTKKPMDRVTDNILERLKVSSIERSFDKIMYEINPRNSDFVYLPFYGDQRLIAGKRLYCVNDGILFRLNNCLIVYMHTHLM